MLDFKFVKGVDALIFTCYDYQVVISGDNAKLKLLLTFLLKDAIIIWLAN